MTRLPAVAVVVVALLIGCGQFDLPLVDRSTVSIAVDGEPGFVSFGGFRWQVTLIAPSGAVATLDPSGHASIAVVPGDYRLDIAAIPLSDLVMCVDRAAPGAATCTRQEGDPVAICTIPIAVPAVTEFSTTITVTDGTTCRASTD
jgi:hypothetical protein